MSPILTLPRLMASTSLQTFRLESNQVPHQHVVSDSGHLQPIKHKQLQFILSRCLYRCLYIPMFFRLNFKKIAAPSRNNDSKTYIQLTCAISAYHNYRCEFKSRSGKVYSIQHYVIKFVSDLRQVGGYLLLLLFPPPIKLTVTI